MFPASAGMIPRVDYIEHLLSGVPRIRGDDPGTGGKESRTRECSPHPRG